MSLFLFFSLPCFALRCALLRELYPDILYSEKELLDQFATAKFRWVGRPRPDGDVVFLEREDGVKYVVRFPSKNSNLPFEEFASLFVRKTPVGRTPETRNLTKEEMTPILKRAREAPAGAKDGLLRWTDASVAVFYPAQKGEEYLNGKGINSPARNVLLKAFISADSGKKIENAQRDWARYWETTSREEKLRIVEDLLASGEIFTGLTVENARQRVVEIMGQKGMMPFKGLFEASASRVPEAVRRQLADHWILFTILGINDFHNSNWLVHEDSVLAIDLAFKSPTFVRGNGTYNIPHQEMPFEWMVDTKEAGPKIMVNWASPELMEYLKGLNPKKVAEISRESGYDLTQENADGMVKRAERLLELRKDSPQ